MFQVFGGNGQQQGKGYTTLSHPSQLSLPHTHSHTGGQRPVNRQVREEEQRLARIFMTIAVLVIILIVFA